MVKLVPGQFYDVSGPDQWTPEKVREIRDAMYVRTEKIDYQSWLVFAALDPECRDNSILLRVRVPDKGVQIEENRVNSSDTLVSRDMLYTQEERKQFYPSVARFLEIADALTEDNTDKRRVALGRTIKEHLSDKGISPSSDFLE